MENTDSLHKEFVNTVAKSSLSGKHFIFSGLEVNLNCSKLKYWQYFFPISSIIFFYYTGFCWLLANQEWIRLHLHNKRPFQIYITMALSIF